MKKIILLLVACILFSSHDMFLKMESFFLEPNTPATIHLYNGTFEKSENVITRNRMLDVSLLSNGERQQLDTTMWSEDGMITVLNFQTGEPGTWVAGVSTSPNNIELSAEDFNEYLRHDGVLDMLEWREQNDSLGQPAVEKYSKHVKAIFQVGVEKTDDWKTPLGYPIEFVPESNPYDLKVGETLQVKLLRKGQPLGNQLVYGGFAAGHDHGHEHTDGGEHSHDGGKMTTDANGVFSLKIDHEGYWFLRTIHMEHSTEPGLTHESNWATLTFEVQPPAHNHESGSIPTALYWVGGILLLAGLVFFFRKK